MTAPSLPETLLRLARLLPERVRVGGGDAGTVTVLVQTREVIAPHLGINNLHSWECIGFAGPDPRYVGGFNLQSHRWLEFALREECEVRGWHLDQESSPHPTYPSYRATIYTPQFRSAQGSSPAHALALAMVGALEGIPDKAD